MTTAYVGKPASRVDGRAKVTGEAKYAAEYNAPDLAHGVVVSSAIAKGRITHIDASAALELPGVLQVFTHENAPRLARSDKSYRDQVAPPGSPFRPLHDDEIKYSAQPVALVSVAAALEMDGQTVKEARLALGGVAHKPWRDRQAEALLHGQGATRDHFRQVAEALLREAKGFGHNNFKVELAKRAIVRALTHAAR